MLLLEMQVVSLYDKTGLSVQPWALDGYECFCYDIRNTDCVRGNVTYVQSDLHDESVIEKLI